MGSQVQIGPKPLGAVAQQDEDNVDEYLGHLVFSTTGEAVVPRDWLLEQWERHELPNSLIPKQPSNWSAYRRAMQELQEEDIFKHYTVYNEVHGREFNCRLSLEKSDEHGSNVFLLYADVFWPEDLIGEEGGDWRSTRVGYFDFRSDDGLEGLLHKREIDKDNVHHEKVMEAFRRSKELEKKMKTHHNFADLQKILKKLRNAIANAVPIRRSVYFFGAHHEETIHNLSQVWQGMNQFKDGGEEIRIEKTPVINLESQRELVASRAREMVEEMVNEIINETIEEWKEDEDETADEAARAIMNQLSDAEEVSSEYNQLLAARLSVKDILQDRMDDLADDQEDIVKKVLDQQTFEEVN